MHHLTLCTLSVNLVVLVLYAVDSIKAQQKKDAVGPQLFLWSPSLLLPAFTTSIDYETWRFLPAYRNNFKRWLTAYSICTLQTPHSKQICFIIGSALWRRAVIWTCGRRCDREIAREPGYWFHLSPPVLPLVNRCLLIPLCSYSTLCPVMQGESNARRHIKVILSPSSHHRRGAASPPRRPSSQLHRSGCVGQVWMNVKWLYECETGRGG